MTFVADQEELLLIETNLGAEESSSIHLWIRSNHSFISFSSAAATMYSLLFTAWNHNNQVNYALHILTHNI